MYGVLTFDGVRYQRTSNNLYTPIDSTMIGNDRVPIIRGNLRNFFDREKVFNGLINDLLKNRSKIARTFDFAIGDGGLDVILNSFGLNYNEFCGRLFSGFGRDTLFSLESYRNSFRFLEKPGDREVVIVAQHISPEHWRLIKQNKCSIEDEDIDKIRTSLHCEVSPEGIVLMDNKTQFENIEGYEDDVLLDVYETLVEQRLDIGKIFPNTTRVEIEKFRFNTIMDLYDFVLNDEEIRRLEIIAEDGNYCELN